MARQSLVTRTFTTTEVIALTVNLETQQTQTETIILAKKVEEPKTVLKMCQKVYDNEKQKVVHVITTNHIEKLLGMTEQFFLENAQELDAETRKMVEQEQNDTETLEGKETTK